MQPDQAVAVTPDGRRAQAHGAASHTPLAAWTQPAPGLLARLVIRYTEGWKWYAANGFAPPASEPAFPLARRGSTAFAGRPARRVRPAALLACGCAPRFALLFPHATGVR